MLWVGWLVIALACALFYRSVQARGSDNEKTRASAWTLAVSGVLNVVIGTNLLLAAARVSPPPAVSPPSGPRAVVTRTDPKTGHQTTFTLTPEETRELDKDPSAALARHSFDGPPPP